MAGGITSCHITILALTCQVVQKFLARVKDTEYTIPNLDKSELNFED